jgi:hypothetical protein
MLAQLLAYIVSSLAESNSMRFDTLACCKNPVSYFVYNF